MTSAELTNEQEHYIRISYTEFHPDRPRTEEITDRNNLSLGSMLLNRLSRNSRLIDNVLESTLVLNFIKMRQGWYYVSDGWTRLPLRLFFLLWLRNERLVMGRTPGVCAATFRPLITQGELQKGLPSLSLKHLASCSFAGLLECEFVKKHNFFWRKLRDCSLVFLLPLLTGTINYLLAPHNSYFCHSKWPGTGIHKYSKNVWVTSKSMVPKEWYESCSVLSTLIITRHGTKFVARDLCTPD